MPRVTRHVPGSFCWWELATPDVERVYAFYQTLFGWGKRDSPIPGGQIYRICDLDGGQVAAMYRPDPAQKLPSAWLPYIAVDSADTAADRISRAGGTILAPPFDVMDVGRMALFQDTEGAHAAVWQPGRHIGADIIRENNTVCWTELAARDAGRAAAFYVSAFGWQADVKSMGQAGSYTEWKVAGDPLSFGGMLQMDEQYGDAPATWTTYFKVADCVATAAAINGAGGKVAIGPFDAPGVGTIAMASDPGGAGFSIIKLTMEGR